MGCNVERRFVISRKSVFVRFEQLYDGILWIRRPFVRARQKKKDKESQKKEAEAKLRWDIAQKPIKKRTGRPPIKVKQDREVFITEQMEKERFERMPYGDVPDR
jgi:hypothetical protein